MEIRRDINETYYNENTPESVKRGLEYARVNRLRVRLFYGDVKTGRDWFEENDVCGYVGRSNGQCKVPLLIHNSRSLGGGAIMTDCIVRMFVDGRQVYKHPKYRVEFKHIIESKHEYPFQVMANGETIARFKTAKQAERWVSFMRGHRMGK